MNSTLKDQPEHEVKVYSEVTAFKLLPNKETIVVGTMDGIILKVEMKEELVEQKITKDDSEDYGHLFWYFIFLLTHQK